MSSRANFSTQGKHVLNQGSSSAPSKQKRSHRFRMMRTFLHSNPVHHNDSTMNSKDEQEIRARLVVEGYVLSKLEQYMKKPRLWQITHSTHLRKRLLSKSSEIATMYSLPEQLVHRSIDQFFGRIDKYYSKLRELVHQLSQTFFKASTLMSQERNPENEWRRSQVRRAREIFGKSGEESIDEEALLTTYRKHILQQLTPTSTGSSTDEKTPTIFDIDQAYEEAEAIGKDYLKESLRNYNIYEPPDLKLIGEMIEHCFNHMKRAPTADDFDESRSFLSKVSGIFKIREAYRSGLRNMGDDFMILRFGKEFGPNALPNTARSNNQFIYLVHLFLQSMSNLSLMMRTTMQDYSEVFSFIAVIIGSLSPAQTIKSIIQLENEDLFSPQQNIDQWTWLLEKWQDALRTLPIVFTEVGAFGRLIRTTIGVAIARMFALAETMVVREQALPLDYLNEQIFYALQLGFYFGVAYAFVDSVQDEIQTIEKNPNHYLFSLFERYKDEQSKSATEIVDQWLSIMEGVLCGKPLDRKSIPKLPLTPLILETYDNMIILTRKMNNESAVFNELALLLRSQRMDKKVLDQCYSDEELYLGAMLKSHFTYTCTTHIGNVKSAREESDRLWIVPFLGQMTDDCRDFYDDFNSSSVTSFTHYASFIDRSRNSSKQPINPFFVFLHLCSDIYLSSSRNHQTGAFAGRRILRTLKSIEISAGESGLRQFLHIFCHDHPFLYDYCWNELRGYFPLVNDPEKTFFRALNKTALQHARTNRKLETYVGDHLKLIENTLHINPVSKDLNESGSTNPDEALLLSAMNYSVRAGGKRLRPLLMMMVSDLYSLDVKRTLPLAQAIEYLHTSSLILDDLPAQDNSDLRRGQPTLHRAVINNDIPENLCEGRAQLAAVDLIAVSLNLINESLSKNGFSPDSIIKLIGEISVSMHDLCIGQMMDLRAARMGIEQGENQLNDLDRIAWFKTGKAIEIALISPAILALSPTIDIYQSIELSRIRELSRLMGILFQMRDDLLDIEGENLGKPMALDAKNNTVTYVSTLGVEECQKRLEKMRHETLKLVDECWPNGAGTIKDVVNYIVERKN